MEQIYEIDKLPNLQKDDVIIIKVDPYLMTPDEARTIYNNIEAKFNNRVIMLFKGIELDKMTWEHAKDYIMSLEPKS